MARGRIPDSFIDDLLARTDIVPVVAARVALKRSGREFSACCPFHSENTPSFTVSPQKQFYHCFGCGAHGTAIGFLMAFEGMDFVDAVEELAGLAGVEVPREGGKGPARPDDADALYAILAEAEAWFQQQLRADGAAIDYLRERGLAGELAARFRLGAAPAAWRGLCEALGTTVERRRLLERAGLASSREDGTAYDRFRGRVIFPIHDTRGRPIAFGGRIFGAHDGPKYLNSPETELFHKGRQLYGLQEARQAVGRPERLVVVEGYMDVLALAQHGIPEAVATLGTATTADHARLLFRTAPEVVFCFDGDRAGRQAAARALEAVISELREGRQARFLFLPEGEDPDTLVRAEGSTGFARRLGRATPFSEFFFARQSAGVDLQALDGRAALVAACRPWLEKMPAGPLREMMFEHLGELARTRIVTGPVGQPPRPAKHRRPSPPERMTRVRLAIRALLHAPGAAAEVALPEGVLTLEQTGIALLGELHAWCAAHPEATTARVLARFEAHEYGRALFRLAADSPFDDPAEYVAQFRDTVARLAGEAAARAAARQRERQLAALRPRSREGGG